MPRARAKLPSLLSALLCLAAVVPAGTSAQSNDELRQMRTLLERHVQNLQHRLDVLSRQVDDVMFFERLGDIADIDLVRFTGPPPRHEPNPTAQGAGNPVRLRAYVFIPRNLDRSHKQPLIVFPHGGVHSNFSTGTTHVLREMLEQGYTVVAPEYRGSTGYGRGFYQEIDYGGLEIEDTYAARKFMLDTYSFLDPARVGIVGWSHGGLHALMNVFEHGKDYAAAYAGVPVSDLIARMGYKTQGYRDLYSADYHIGKTAYEDVNEYRRRSPSWNTAKYDGTPLLIHTNTTDEDVNVLEVERLIQALKAEGKAGFHYKIYQDAPGGHSFNRLDTPLARESRREIWRFLAPYLKPDHPIR
ncbi:MAG: alpha/beta fold hydrolase [Gemmatimonadota bacterium]|jgi:dipeptidyl aminopeptidase/acylaminoacyl peptidase